MACFRLFDIEWLMKLPTATSKLLALQDATNVELNVRLGEMFRRYRSTAFIGRNDRLFTEHWTPKQAAAGYDFERFELRETEILLHGVEHTGGFVYRISIAIPLAIIDHLAAIDDYFERLQAENKSKADLSRPSDRTQ
jgi:hypothetical protein